MRFFVIIFLLSLSVANAIAEAQPTSPSKGKEKEQIEGKTTNEQSIANTLQGQVSRFSEISTTHRKFHSDPANNKKDDKTTEEGCWGWFIRFSKLFSGGLAAIFTGGLLFVACVQLRMFRNQLTLMRDGLSEASATSQAAKESAEVAQKSANALITSERPYVFAEAYGHIEPSDMKPGTSKFTCVCSIANRGKTPAIINIADCKLMRSEEVNYSMRKDWQLPAKGIALGISDEPLRFDRSEDLLTGDLLNGNLVLYGKVEYKDIFGQSHETEFELVFHNNISRFCVSGNTDRNRYT